MVALRESDRLREHLAPSLPELAMNLANGGVMDSSKICADVLRMADEELRQSGIATSDLETMTLGDLRRHAHAHHDQWSVDLQIAVQPLDDKAVVVTSLRDPDLLLLDVLSATVSIPLVYRPVRIPKYGWCADGATLHDVMSAPWLLPTKCCNAIFVEFDGTQHEMHLSDKSALTLSDVIGALIRLASHTRRGEVGNQMRLLLPARQHVSSNFFRIPPKEELCAVHAAATLSLTQQLQQLFREEIRSDEGEQ